MTAQRVGMARSFIVRFAVGNRLGAGSRYSLRDICICIVDRYSLTESELCTIVTLQLDESWSNDDMTIKRIK